MVRHIWNYYINQSEFQSYSLYHLLFIIWKRLYCKNIPCSAARNHAYLTRRWGEVSEYRYGNRGRKNQATTSNTQQFETSLILFFMNEYDILLNLRNIWCGTLTLWITSKNIIVMSLKCTMQFFSYSFKTP